MADVGTKKGEKVDYAIFRDGEPIIVFECKHYGLDHEQGKKRPSTQKSRTPHKDRMVYFGIYLS